MLYTKHIMGKGQDPDFIAITGIYIRKYNLYDQSVESLEYFFIEELQNEKNISNDLKIEVLSELPKTYIINLIESHPNAILKDVLIRACISRIKTYKLMLDSEIQNTEGELNKFYKIQQEKNK